MLTRIGVRLRTSRLSPVWSSKRDAASNRGQLKPTRDPSPGSGGRVWLASGPVPGSTRIRHRCTDRRNNIDGVKEMKNERRRERERERERVTSQPSVGERNRC